MSFFGAMDVLGWVLFLSAIWMFGSAVVSLGNLLWWMHAKPPVTARPIPTRSGVYRRFRFQTEGEAGRETSKETA